MPSRFRVASRVALLTLLAHGSASARAQRPGKWRISFVAWNEVGSRGEPLDAAVRGHLADLPAIFTVVEAGEAPQSLQGQLARVTRIATEERADLTFWLEPVSRKLLLLHMTEPPRTLARRLAGPVQSREEIEALALMVRGVVDALLRGGRVAVEESELVEPMVIASEASRMVLGIAGAAYAAETFADRLPVQHGVALALGIRLRSGVTISLQARLLSVARFNLGPDRVTLVIRRLPFRAGVLREWSSPRWSGGLGGSLVVDAVGRTTEKVASGLVAGREGLRFEVGAGPFVEGTLHLLWRLRIRARLGGEVTLNPARYVVPQEDVGLASWPLRAAAEVGIEARF